MAEGSAIWEIISGEGDIGGPDFFLSTTFIVAILVLADFMFSGLRSGNLPQIITALVFTTSIIAYLGVTRGKGLLGNTSPLEGAGMFLIGGLPLLVGSLGKIKFSFFSLASASYLSSVLSRVGEAYTLAVNNFFAPVTETWLIVPTSFLILFFINHTKYTKDLPNPVKILIAGLPPSIAFAVLHGATNPAFAVFAVGFMLLSVAAIVYEESLPGSQVPYVKITIGLLISVHASFNIANSGGLLFVLSKWWSTGQWSFQLLAAYFVTMYILGAVYWISWIRDRA